MTRIPTRFRCVEDVGPERDIRANPEEEEVTEQASERGVRRRSESLEGTARRDPVWHVREAATRALGLEKTGQQGTGRAAGEAGARAPRTRWDEGACRPSEAEQKRRATRPAAWGVLPAAPPGGEAGEGRGLQGGPGRAQAPVPRPQWGPSGVPTSWAVFEGGVTGFLMDLT